MPNQTKYQSDLEAYKRQKALLESQKAKDGANWDAQTSADWLAQYKMASTNQSLAENALKQYQENNTSALSANNQAYVAQEKAKKAVQDSLNYAGLGTQGIVGTEQSAIQNAYASTVGNVNASKLTANSDLLSNYNSQLNSNNLALAEQETNSLLNRENEAKSEAEANQIQNYNFAVESINSAPTTALKQQILEQYRDKISEEQYNNLANNVDIYYQSTNYEANLNNMIEKAETEEDYQNILNSNEFNALEEYQKTLYRDSINEAISEIESNNESTEMDMFFEEIFQGKHPYDYANTNSKQYQWQQEIFDRESNGQIETGDIYNFNYGKGSGMFAMYLGNGNWRQLSTYAEVMDYRNKGSKLYERK